MIFSCESRSKIIYPEYEHVSKEVCTNDILNSVINYGKSVCSTPWMQWEWDSTALPTSCILQDGTIGKETTISLNCGRKQQ